MSDAVWALFVGIGGIAAGGLLLGVVMKWPLVAFVIAGAQILFLAEFPTSFTLLSVGGFAVTAMDLFSILLVAATLLRIGRIRRSWPIGFFTVLSLCVAVAVVVGYAYFGAAAVNEARNIIWSLACLMWSISLDWKNPDLRRRILRSIVVLGWFLLPVAAIHFAQHGFGTYGDDFINDEGDSVDRRIVSSGQALVLLFGVFSSVFLARHATRYRALLRFSAVIFALLVLLSQQRTVWVVAAIAIAIAFVMDRRGRASSVFIALFGGVGVLLLINSNLFTSLLSDLGQAAQNVNTYDSRVSGWLALIQKSLDAGPLDVLFGQPFGSGYTRVEDGRLATYSPHNWYVNLFVRVGLVGLVLYVLGVAGVLVRLVRSRASLVGLLFLVSVITYGWTYNPPWYATIFLGLPVVMAIRTSPPAEDDFEATLGDAHLPAFYPPKGA